MTVFHLKNFCLLMTLRYILQSQIGMTALGYSMTVRVLLSIKDLKIIFDAKFTFIERVDTIVAKAFKTYGFVYRNYKSFQH